MQTTQFSIGIELGAHPNQICPSNYSLQSPQLPPNPANESDLRIMIPEYNSGLVQFCTEGLTKFKF